MAPEQVETVEEKKAGGKKRFGPIVVVALLMLGEGVGVFFLAKMLGDPPAPALGVMDGATEGGDSSDDQSNLAEVEIAECRPSNLTSGKLISIDIRVTALVIAEDLEEIEKMVRAKRARLEDGVNSVIRSAELKDINEPSLATIKRQLKFRFDRILDNPELIKQILIPRLNQSGRGV